MESSGAIGTLIAIITGLTTFKGLQDSGYFDAYKFHVGHILSGKEYKRIITSGFLHGGWFHYAFNMLTLIAFSVSLELIFGYVKFLVIYFGSKIGGSLLALFVHRNHGDYSAIGASGAVSGVLLASVLLYPDDMLSFIIIPIEIKSWIFALLFILLSIFGIKSQKGNIGHEAHLGGALTGILLAVAFQPSLLTTSLWVVLLMALPIIAFLILIVRNPNVLIIDKYWGETLSKGHYQEKKKAKKNKLRIANKAEREETLNHLLDKIRKDGIRSLSEKEKELLDRLTNDL